MSWNTTKTVLGFFGSFIQRLLPKPLAPKRLTSIYNYRPITDRIHSSGQPTAEQFQAIRDEGFRMVINLAPHGAENALPDEAGALDRLGLPYVHIPVDFKAPSEEAFAEFVSVMERHNDEKVWVHCAANMRVSAFLYRYRRDVLGEDEAMALEDLKAIWDPFGAWTDFIAPKAHSSD